ncbi:MAG: urease accessory protein UreF, partial [Hyphomicrobiaceae bacterium]
YGLPLGATLSAFAAAFVTNMTSALVRLAVIGQTDGQRVIVSLMPAIEKLAAVAGNSTLEDVGGAAFLSDIAAMAHETQDTRLFRT